MRNTRMCVRRDFLFLSVFFVFSSLLPAWGQKRDNVTNRTNVVVNGNCHAYIESLPNDYSAPGNSSKRYPLFFFIQGNGSTGNGTDTSMEKMYNTGGWFIQNLIQAQYDGFPDAFNVNGADYQFIYIAPQWLTDYDTRFPTPEEVNSILDFMIAHYRIDTTRIYLSGNSSGAAPVWDYVGASSTYADRIAAIIPFCSNSFSSLEKANRIRNSNLPVWAFHNRYDEGVSSSFTIDFVNLVNQAPLPAIPARMTIFDTSGHDCWGRALRGFNRPPLDGYSENDQDIYQWMLQYSRSISKAKAGVDQDIYLPVNSTQLSAGGSGPNGTHSIYKWEKVSGPTGGNLSSTSSANTTVNNLELGTYVYRLTITDNAGGQASDQVAINVFSPKIEGENYTAMSGVRQIPNADLENGVAVQIDSANWVDYTLNVPSSGTYPVRYRFATKADKGTRLLVKNASGAILDDFIVPNTSGWNVYATLTRSLPLSAGPQTIRMESTADNRPGINMANLNWLEVMNTGTAFIPTPVNFILFNARCENGAVSLTWKTAGEMNTRDFTVETSPDGGRNWKSIGSIPAVGQTSSEQTYTYRDNTPGAGLYRIVANDHDGRKTISSLIRSQCGGKQVFTVFPNPVMDRAILSVNLEQPARMQVSLLDSRGAIVQKQVQDLPVGNSQVTIDMNSLSKGSYTLYVLWGNERETMKLVKN